MGNCLEAPEKLRVELEGYGGCELSIGENKIVAVNTVTNTVMMRKTFFIAIPPAFCDVVVNVPVPTSRVYLITIRAQGNYSMSRSNQKYY